MLLSSTIAAVAMVPTLKNSSLASSSGYSTYIVAFNNQPGTSSAMAEDQVTSFVNSYNGQIIDKYSIINGMAVTIPDDKVGDLKAMANVRYVEKDLEVHVLLDKAVPQIGGDQVWAAGYSGKGVKVAVIDTGVDASHPDLNGNKVVGWVDYVNGKTTPYDDHGHGTHVSSTIAGTGAADNGKYKGVAPNASLIVAKVLDKAGSGSDSNIIKGIQWAVDNHAQVISMSLGSTTHSQSMCDALDNAVKAGVICVIAAGNSGPAAKTICSPGDDLNVITVGASDRKDVIASFSSRGPNSDGSVKPDITNMGVGLVAARATGLSDGTPVDQYYTAMSGTSMATPMTSGTVALLLSAKAGMSPQQVKDVLEKTAKPLGGSVPNNNYGYGRVDAKAALDYVLSGQLPAPTPTPTPGPNPTPTPTPGPNPTPTPTPQPGGNYAVSLMNLFARYNGQMSTSMDKFQVTPGTTVSQSVMLANNGNVADSYTISMNGVPATWYQVTGYTGGSVDPNAAASMSLTVTPPAGTAAGAYKFTLTATSNSDRSVSATKSYTVNVGGATAPGPTPTVTPRPTTTPGPTITPTPGPNPSPTPVPGNAFSGSVSSGGDYYTYIVPAHAGQITAKIAWQGTTSDLNMYLYDPDGKLVAKSEQRYTTTESLQYNAPKSGYYLLKVHAQNAFQPVAFTGAASPTVKTAYVKTGSLAKGQSSTVNILSDGASNINAMLAWNWGFSTLTMSLYDPAGNKVTQVTTPQGGWTTPYEQLNFAPAQAGPYTLKIDGVVSGTVSYKLVSPYQL